MHNLDKMHNYLIFFFCLFVIMCALSQHFVEGLLANSSVRSINHWLY